jgi:hypothetical protein
VSVLDVRVEALERGPRIGGRELPADSVAALVAVLGPAELGTVVAFFTPALEILERENR